jgi:hypothetical protein
MELHYWQRRSQALLVHAPAPLRSRRRRGRAGLVKKPPWPRRPARPWARQLVRELGEVEVRGAALDGDRCDVVRPRGHLRVVERAEPDARLLARLTDLRHPLAPGPHPHTAVRRVFQVPAQPLLAAAGVVAGAGRRRVQGAAGA